MDDTLRVGISRFVATGRRLQALKEGKAPSAAALKGSRIEAVINFRITRWGAVQVVYSVRLTSCIRFG